MSCKYCVHRYGHDMSGASLLVSGLEPNVYTQHTITIVFSQIDRNGSIAWHHPVV